MSQQRMSRTDWLELAFSALSADGPDGITIEALCRRSGKTKGAFYAHFKTIDACLDALADTWKKRFTIDLIAATPVGEAPAERLTDLNRLAVALDPRVEQGMRRLAIKEPIVRNVCVEVDRLRVAHLTELYAASVHYTRKDAEILARIEYAAFVGLQQLEPDARPETLHELFTAYVRLTRKP
jgi:AcrR family transcriptional regulator